MNDTHDFRFQRRPDMAQFLFTKTILEGNGMKASLLPLSSMIMYCVPGIAIKCKV